jgi:3-phenylpropionate/cinnamic acid dioxygenase small subunit
LSALQELFEDNSTFLDRKSLAGRALIFIEDCLFRMANGEIDWKTFISDAKEKLEFLSYSKKDGLEARDTKLRAGRRVLSLLEKSTLTNKFKLS